MTTTPNPLNLLRDALRQQDDPRAAIAALVEKYECNFAELREVKVFSQTSPYRDQMKDLWAHVLQVTMQAPILQDQKGREDLIRLAALYHDVGKVRTLRYTGCVTFHHHEAESATMWDVAAKRLGLDLDYAAEVRPLIASLGRVEAATELFDDSAIRRLMRDLGGLSVLENLLLLSSSDITTKHAHKRNRILSKIDRFRERARELDRLDAIPQALPHNLGLSIQAHLGLERPGPAIGVAMKKLKSMVEAGKLPRNDPDHSVYLREL